MSERMPPKRRRTPNERGMTEEEILRDRSGLDPLARYPLATNRDPGYIVGGPQMTDPRHFELMQRNREEARTQGTRLKKGGPVKKYEEGGMVEIEIKVGAGGKGKHKMPDGSMMDDSEMEDAEEYKKGGKVKKMAKGGATGGKWIQSAIKKPGALRAQMGVKAGQKIPAKKLATAAKAPGKLGQRARFAQTLAKMRKK
jgi:hypothetical protein